MLYRDLNRLYRTAVRGEGVYLYDETGRRYIDACGGALAVNLGHGRADLARAMAEQASKVAYIHGSQFTTEPIEQWAARLVEKLPSRRYKLYPVPGGTEATETAIKLARQYQLARGRASKYLTLACRPSYHGNTLGSLSVSGRDGLRKAYEPLLGNREHAPAPYCYRCPLAKTYPECGVACADAVGDLFERLGPENVAAFVAEAVTGAAAGAAVPPPEYLPRVKAICERYDVVLIVDEVLAGFGRTGSFLAVSRSGIVPDVILMGKGLTGAALPGGAVAAGDHLVEAIHEKLGGFTHGYTFSHHPVVAAVMLEVLEILDRERLVERVAELEAPFFEGLETLRRFPFVGDVRGRGLLAGIELVSDAATKKPFPRSRRFVEEAVERAFGKGLVVYSSTGLADGVDGDALMLAPPFVIEPAQIDEIVRILGETFSEMH